MRFMTQAYRIKFGNAIFVTFSPDESHNLLMIRLSRTRQNDPVWTSKTNKPLRRYAKQNIPALTAVSEDQVFTISAEDLCNTLPSYDERRRILATDSLASVEGF